MLANPRPDLGVMLQPGMGNVIPFHRLRWAADNGCYAQGKRFDAIDWLEWLASLRPGCATCLFAVLPDVLGDWRATRDRSEAYFGSVKQLGLRPAFVAQDGEQGWPADTQALFIGGSDAWKLSESAYLLASRAKRAGLWLHLGRVNSLRRLRAASVSGYDSADGTHVRFSPSRNLPHVYHWLDRVNRQQVLQEDHER